MLSTTELIRIIESYVFQVVRQQGEYCMCLLLVSISCVQRLARPLRYAR